MKNIVPNYSGSACKLVEDKTHGWVKHGKENYDKINKYFGVKFFETESRVAQACPKFASSLENSWKFLFPSACTSQVLRSNVCTIMLATNMIIIWYVCMNVRYTHTLTLGYCWCGQKQEARVRGQQNSAGSPGSVENLHHWAGWVVFLTPCKERKAKKLRISFSQTKEKCFILLNRIQCCFWKTHGMRWSVH